MKRFYLYRHIRKNDFFPFYIGIGTIYDKNLFHEKYSRAFSKKHRNNYWKNIVKKCGYNVQILFETDDINKIKLKEKEFIKIYGLTCDGGILCNLTYGGDGIEGFKHSEKTKKIISFHSKTRIRKSGYKSKMTAQGRENISKYQKNKIVSNITREKYSKALLGNTRGKGHSVPTKLKEKIIDILSKGVYQFDKNGIFIKKFKNLKEAKFHGFDGRGISRCHNGITKLYKNFKWLIEKSKKQLQHEKSIEDIN